LRQVISNEPIHTTKEKFMPQHRTRYSAEFKAKVALAALSESKTLSELASEYKVKDLPGPSAVRCLVGESAAASAGKHFSKRASSA